MCTHEHGKCVNGVCSCVGMYVGNGIECRGKKRSIYENGSTRRVNKKKAVFFWLLPGSKLVFPILLELETDYWVKHIT